MDKILIVDSEPKSGAAIYRKLSSMGYSTTLTTSGLEALGLVYSDRFDLAIIDTNSSDIEGVTLLRAIKKQSPHTATMMLANRALSNPLSESLRQGASDFITRPLAEDALEKAVLSVLKKGHGMKDSGNLEQNPMTNTGANLRRAISYGLLDSLLAGIAFCLGFILLRFLQSNPLFVGRMELLYLSLGMSFCYAFIFVYRKSHIAIENISHLRMVGDISKNLALAYLLDLAMLFTMKDSSFMAFRMALVLGFALGLILLYAGRMASGTVRRVEIAREGKRRLIIAAPLETLTQKPILASHNTGNRIPEEISYIASEPPVNNDEELHLDSEVMSSDDLLNALDLLQDGKTRVVIHRQSDTPAKRRETISTRQ
jgi:DNA-binding response OmpR family regulator